MNVIESKVVRTSTTRRIEVDRESLLKFLAPHFDCGDVPSNAAVYIQVPGGGDWANEQLDIGVMTPIIITWTEVTDD